MSSPSRVSQAVHAQIARKQPANTLTAVAERQQAAEIATNTIGHTMYHCSSTPSDHRCRSSGGSAGE